MTTEPSTACAHAIGTTGDQPELLEHRITTLLGGLDHAGVATRPEGETVRTIDPGVPKRRDREGDRVRGNSS